MEDKDGKGGDEKVEDGFDDNKGGDGTPEGSFKN